MLEIKRRKVKCFCPTCKEHHFSFIRCLNEMQVFTKRCLKCKNRLKNVNSDFISSGTAERRTHGGKSI